MTVEPAPTRRYTCGCGQKFDHTFQEMIDHLRACAEGQAALDPEYVRETLALPSESVR